MQQKEKNMHLNLSRLPRNPRIRKSRPPQQEMDLQSKKPYLSIGSITQERDKEHLILYDRYRFHIIQFPTSNDQIQSQDKAESSTNLADLVGAQAAQTLRGLEKSIVYLNFQEKEQVLVILAHQASDTALWVYDFNSQKFAAENFQLPKGEISEHINVAGGGENPQAASSVGERGLSSLFKEKFKASIESKINSIQGGVPKFKLLNSNINLDQKNFCNGNQFEILYFPQTNNIAIISQKHGLKMFKLTQAKQIQKPIINQIYKGSLHSYNLCIQNLLYNSEEKFYFAQKIELISPTRSNPELAKVASLYQPHFNLEQQFRISQYVFRDLRTARQSLLIREKCCDFSIEISEGLFQALDPTENPFVQEFLACTNQKSMKIVFGVNLKRSFEVYLVDANCKDVQINLRRRMDFELLSSTRGSHIYSIQQNEQAGIFVIATTNHNFMCFDCVDGSFIKVRSESVLNQSIVPNRKYFLNTIFGQDNQQIMDLDHICLVKIIGTSRKDAQFLIFFGKKIIKVTLDIEFNKANLPLPSQNSSNFLNYNMNYPEKIDRNCLIHGENEIYLNIPRHMLALIEDTNKILKLQRHQKFSDREILLQNQIVQQHQFSKCIIKHQFNAVYSLIVQNRIFEGAALIKMVNQAMLDAQRPGGIQLSPAPALLPKNIILGTQNNVYKSKALKFFQVLDKKHQTVKVVHEPFKYPRPNPNFQNQMETFNFMVILKYLATIRAQKDDPIFMERANHSQVVSLGHQEKIVKAHHIIHLSAYGESQELCLLKFGNLLEAIYEYDFLKTFYSQRKVIGLYDMVNQYSRSKYSLNVDHSNSFKILQGLYGPLHVKKRFKEQFGFKLKVQNRFEKSVRIFSKNYEQLQTFEYYLLVNIYGGILYQALLNGESCLKVKLPKHSKIMESWREANFLNFSQELQTQGQYEYRKIDLNFVPKTQVFDLNLAFYAYLGQTNKLLDEINACKITNLTASQNFKQLKELLFMCKLFSEIKSAEKIPDKSQNAIFLHLMKLTLYQSKNAENQHLSKMGRPPLKGTDQLSLKLGLSALNYILSEMNILDPSAPFAVQCQEILYKLVLKANKGAGVNDKYPKFIMYLLQNVNQININQFTERNQTCLPLDPGSLKTFNFIFESMALYLNTNEIQIDITKHKLIQTPDLKEAIINCIQMTDFEHKVQRQITTNEITQKEYYKRYHPKLTQLKTSLWKFFIFMWYIECLYILQNPTHLSNPKNEENSKHDWAVRIKAVQKFMGIKSRTLKLDKAKLSNNKLYELYFGERASPDRASDDQGREADKQERIIEYLSRSFLDPQFTRFVHKLPKIFKYYALSQQELVYNKHAAQIENVIQVKYKDVYDKFRNIFGLKLNYSVRLITDRTRRQNQRIQLIQRIKKRWFKFAKESKELVLKEKQQQSKRLLGSGSISALSAGELTLNLQDQLNQSFQSSQRGLTGKDEEQPDLKINETKELDENIETKMDPSLKDEKYTEDEFYQNDDQKLEESVEIKEKNSEEVVMQAEPQVLQAKPVVPKLALIDAQIQTSLEFQKMVEIKSQKALSEQQVSDRKFGTDENDAKPDEYKEDLEEEISPQKFIDLQLQEIERQQRDKEREIANMINLAALKIDKMIWKKFTKLKYRAFFRWNQRSEFLKQKANFRRELKAMEKLEKHSHDLTTMENDMSQSQRTQLTADRSGWQPQRPRRVSPEDQEGKITLVFDDQSPKSPLFPQKNNTMRQSKTHRRSYVDHNQYSKMVYYDINGRLGPTLPTRKAQLNETSRNFQTIQNSSPGQSSRYDKFATVEEQIPGNADLSGDVGGINTSRFGKQEQLQGLYQKERHRNYQSIIQHEQDYEQLSGSRSGSRSPMSPRTPEMSPEPEIISRKQRAISPASDRSTRSRFVYPIEHLKKLERQKSPLRRSHSAKFLRDMIQGYQQKEFYEVTRKPGRAKNRVTQNLIRYNQHIMAKDFKNQTERLERHHSPNPFEDLPDDPAERLLRQTSAFLAGTTQVRMIGQQVKLHYNNYVINKHQPMAKSPQQILNLMQTQKLEKKKQRQKPKIRLINFSKRVK